MAWCISLYSRSFEDTRSQSRRGKIWEWSEDNSSLGCQESKTKVKKSSIRRRSVEKHITSRFSRGLCHEKQRRPCKTPSRNTRSDFVLQRDNVTDEEGCRAIFTEQALQRLRWQWQSSWKLSQSFQVWLEKQVTQVQRALKSKWPKLPDCYDCHMKHVLRCGSGFLHDKDQTVGMIFKTPWYLLKRIFIWSLVSGPSLGKKNLKKCNVKREVNKCQYGNAFTITKSSDYFYRFMWRCTKMLERSRAWDPYGNFGKKKSTSKIKRFS